MIQLLGLRSFVPKDSKDGKQLSYDKIYEIDSPPETPKELFANLDKVLDQIHPDHRWNLFYTIAASGPGKREFQWTKTLAFDIDGVNQKYEDAYIEVITSALKLQRDEVGVVSSGNGYHFLLELKQKITDKSFFENMRPHYKAVCAMIDERLAKAGIPGKADSAIFEPRRILRLPGTVNRKPDKPEKLCTLLSPIGKPVDFHLDVLSGLPTVLKTDQVDKRILQKYPKVYPAAVLAGCDFLKSCHASPNNIDEPAWYAALSITARLDGEGSTGRERSHELSRGHRSYSAEETDKKIDQALEASGPRTCESINNTWGKCATCPNFGKVTSPLLLRGPDAIPTEDTGFHHIITQKNGAIKYVPCHEDLLAYMKREEKACVLSDTRIVYAWSGKHYEIVEKAALEAYARTHFVPTPDMKTCEEFRKRAGIANVKPLSWWSSSVNRKMNFLNGYLEVDTLNFRPHDPDIAFRQVLPYEYDPDAKAPTFEKMLSVVTGGDLDTIRVLEEFIGYCLSNDTCWAQKALVLTGDGANGKSTFIDTLKMVAGKGNFTSINMDKIDDEYNLATLDGKLFNIGEETSPKAFRNNATFKNLVTGGSCMVRMIYKEPYEMSNRAKLILTCNELPDSLDSTHGFYRRLLVVPFNQTIDETTPGYDPHVLEKLKHELPGIFNLAIAGYRRLVKQRGFSKARRLNESLEDYRLDNDSVLYWVKEHLVVHKNGGFEDHFTPIADLYASYRACMISMSRVPVHQQKFAKQIAKLRGEDIWGEHPYPERAVRKRVEVRGQEIQVRGLKGVSLPIQ